MGFCLYSCAQKRTADAFFNASLPVFLFGAPCRLWNQKEHGRHGVPTEQMKVVFQMEEIKTIMQQNWNKNASRYDAQYQHGLHSEEEKAAWLRCLAA